MVQNILFLIWDSINVLKRPWWRLVPERKAAKHLSVSIGTLAHRL